MKRMKVTFLFRVFSPFFSVLVRDVLSPHFSTEFLEEELENNSLCPMRPLELSFSSDPRFQFFHFFIWSPLSVPSKKFLERGF